MWEAKNYLIASFISFNNFAINSSKLDVLYLKPPQVSELRELVGEIRNLGAHVAGDGRKALDCFASREPVNQDCTQNSGFQAEPS